MQISYITVFSGVFTVNSQFAMHKLHLVNYRYFHPHVENFFFICIYPRKAKNKRRKIMKLEIQFKLKININHRMLVELFLLIVQAYLGQ